MNFPLSSFYFYPAVQQAPFLEILNTAGYFIITEFETHSSLLAMKGSISKLFWKSPIIFLCGTEHRWVGAQHFDG